MPTPVESARQCLTAEAAKAFDGAVEVARRRGHAQTTSLHVVSAMLSHPSSTLRDACARLQFRALELSLSVSLDRAPSTSGGADNPPVSNSLMAAIKRSQATQRRQPENYHLQQYSPSSVKVDLQHLILSILDDPVVSRVFAEAGFRSSEIKLAILRPLSRLMHQQHSLGRSFPFPFSGKEDADHRRIAEVLSRNRGSRRNPLLIGTCARDALWGFEKGVEQRICSVLPRELCSLHVMCIGREVLEFLSGSCEEVGMGLRFKEIGEMVEQRMGQGVVVDFGDLEVLVNEKNGWGESEGVRYVVGELGKLLGVSYGYGYGYAYERLWLIGAAASYERYIKFVGRFPSIEREWDLQLLPIVSLPSSILVKSYQNCRREPGARTASTADLCLPNLPPRYQIAELGSAKGLHLKLEDDGVVLNCRSESATHKNLDKICQNLHNNFPDANNCPTAMGFQCSDNKWKDANNINSEVLVDNQTVSTSQSNSSFPMDLNAKQEKYASKLSDKFQRAEGLELGDLGSCNMSTSIVCDGSHTSPTSVISVTTDLGLGMFSSPSSNKSNKPSTQCTMEPPKEISSLFSSKFNVADGNILKHPFHPSTFLSFDFGGQVDVRNPKVLFDVLTKEVSWQDEALSVISRTIACSHSKRVAANQRGDVWMNFAGPDRNGKKKIAVSLAKFLYGSRDNFIFVDLSSEEMKGCNMKFRGKTTLDFIVGEFCKKPFSVVFIENVDKGDVLVQNSLSQAIKTGKLTDSHGREVGVKNAIFVTSFSGHQAREPSSYSEERIIKAKGRPIKITVEHVSGDIKSHSVTVADGLIESIPNPVLDNKRKFIGHKECHDQHLISGTAKRAHTTPNWHLDLNLPAEDNELQVQQMNDGDLEHNGNQNLWLQDLYDQVDETVVFKPFNFDALADRVVRVITGSFHKTIGSECALQIESEVMDQLLAAAYVSDGDKDIENWAEEVLSGGFTEVQRRHSITACSIVKLVSCSHQASSVYLPASITMD